MEETGVQLCVGCLHLEGVCLLALIVQSLQKHKLLNYNDIYKIEIIFNPFIIKNLKKMVIYTQTTHIHWASLYYNSREKSKFLVIMRDSECFN